MLMGDYFRKKMNDLAKESDLVNLIRGKGLLNALVINDSEDSSTGWDICLKMKDKGLIAKPTHGNIIRFAPPLVINKKEIDESCQIKAIQYLLREHRIYFQLHLFQYYIPLYQ